MKKVLSAISCSVLFQLLLCLYVGVFMPLATKAMIGDVMKYTFEGKSVYWLCAFGCAVFAGLFLLARWFLKKRDLWHPAGTAVFHGISAAVLPAAGILGFLAFRRDFAESPIFLFSGEGKGALYSVFFLLLLFTCGLLAFGDALLSLRRLSATRFGSRTASILLAVFSQAWMILWLCFCYLLFDFVNFRYLHRSSLGAFMAFLLYAFELARCGLAASLVMFFVCRSRMMGQEQWHRDGTHTFFGISIALILLVVFRTVTIYLGWR